MRTLSLTLFCLILLTACRNGSQNLPAFPPAEQGPHAMENFIRPSEPSQASEQPNQPATDTARAQIIFSGQIELSPAIASKVKTGSRVLFIIARSPDGGPPLAVKKLSVERFPAPFSLTSADVMVPGQEIQGPIRLMARLDADGYAGPAQSGDFEGGLPETIQMGAANLTIIIDRKI